MIAWQDAVLATGTAVGLASKAHALRDPRTQWSRWASLPNAALYSASVVAFASLGLWLTAALATLSMLLWVGIGLYRAPEDQ
jgi:hypothetical protein